MVGDAKQNFPFCAGINTHTHTHTLLHLTLHSSQRLCAFLPRPLPHMRCMSRQVVKKHNPNQELPDFYNICLERCPTPFPWSAVVWMSQRPGQGDPHPHLGFVTQDPSPQTTRNVGRKQGKWGIRNGGKGQVRGYCVCVLQGPYP